MGYAGIKAKKYEERPDVELQEVIEAIPDLDESFWEAFSINGVVGNQHCKQATIMGFIENEDDERLGRLVREQIIKCFIRESQQKIESRHNRKSDIEDMESALL